MSIIDDSLSVAVQRKHFEHNCFEKSKNVILPCLAVQRLTNYPNIILKLTIFVFLKFGSVKPIVDNLNYETNSLQIIKFVFHNNKLTF